MSEAIVDDITIGLMSWQADTATSGQWIATLRVASAADRPVRFVPELIFVTAEAGGQPVVIPPRPESGLPCSLSPGERATITLRFRIEPGQSAQRLTVGLEEEHRSGAHVVFPLGSGAASARGGDGAAGANATGGDATGTEATAPGSPAPTTQASSATPTTGACQH